MNIKQLDLQKVPKTDGFSNTKRRGTYCKEYKRKINVNKIHKTVVTRNPKKDVSHYLKVLIVML